MENSLPGKDMLKKTSNWNDPVFDTIIDVRAPSEFAEDHIIGSINCPVLNDVERSEVGFIYKNISGYRAKLKGASLTAKNIAMHIESQFSQFSGAWQPLVYCWRGGQRSRAMALVMQEIGWRVTLLDGGHKKYRENIIDLASSLPKKLRFVLISGKTGSGKTILLKKLDQLGAQVLDLEALAKHRGSLLGSFPSNQQPSQKYFESLIVTKLLGFSGSRVIFVESESSKVGNLHIPAGLWRAMKIAPFVELVVPPQVRANFLIENYSDLKQDIERFKKLFLRAKSRINSEVILL